MNIYMEEDFCGMFVACSIISKSCAKFSENNDYDNNEDDIVTPVP